MTPEARLRRIRILIAGFIAGLALSGITAFPLTWELHILVDRFGAGDGALATWLKTVQHGLVETDAKYPFLAYGTDWLAFGHLVIATAFVGPMRDPVRNKWIIEWGMIACAAVPVLALVAGPIRGIPLGWQLIDCSFGVVGIFPLWFVLREIKTLEKLTGVACLTENVPVRHSEFRAKEGAAPRLSRNKQIVQPKADNQPTQSKK